MTTLREAAQQALAAMENIDKEFRRYGRQHWPEAVKALAAITALRAALAEPEERNFCPRCGKRTNDIHTCTPPGDQP